MLKKIIWLLKRVIKSSLFIYAYDSFSLGFSLLIPINFLTIIIVSFFGIYGILAIFLLSLFI